MSNDREEPDELAYDPEPDPEWARQVDRWPWIERDGEGAAKTGACPRCGHHMSVLDGEPGSGGGEETPRMSASCNCGAAHPGAPEGKSGCGANGSVERA